MAWTPEHLDRLAAAHELEVAVARPDGSLRPGVVVWVVVTGGRVFVRTWYRRETGWFGRVRRTRRARVRVPGVDVDVRVDDVGAALAGGTPSPADLALAADVDAAYRAKYGHPGDEGVSGMVTPQARPTTLELVPLSS